MSIMQKFFSLLFIFFLCACEENKNTITIYTSLPERDTQVLLDEFSKENTGISVNFFRSGTNEVISKLRAEFMADSPKADVILLADEVTMTVLKNENRLMSLADIDVSQMHAGTYDKDRTFFGIALIGTGLVCHKEFVPSSKSLRHLASEEMTGKVVMPSPIFSGSAAINLSLIASKKELGWQFLEKFLNNKPLFVKGNGSVMDTVLKKGRVCGIIVDFMALNAIKEGANLSFYYFDEGAPIIHEPVAILKGTKNFENAKKFVTFILGKHGQTKLSALGYRPIRKDIPVPATFANTTALKIMPMDVSEVLGRIEKDRERFAKNHA